MSDIAAYHALIARKAPRSPMRGLVGDLDLNPRLRPLQADVTAFALRQGQSAAFLDTGLGKTLVQLEFGRQVVEATNRPFLLLAPLAVGAQHAREAAAFGIDARVVREPGEIGTRVFIADQTEMGRYRLKRAAVRPFWSWVASWARCASRPSDLGHSDAGYELPPLSIPRHDIAVDRGAGAGPGRDGQHALFRMPETSATARHGEKRLTLDARVGFVADLVAAEPDEPWIVWCETNYEADALCASIPDALDVRGAMSPEEKEDKLTAFSLGHAKRIVTKTSIAGFGLNWQHCARQAFADPGYSYESFYQGVRRSWRFGQTREVRAHVAVAETQIGEWRAIQRKAREHDEMKAGMAEAMRRAGVENPIFQAYAPGSPATLPAWLASRP
ncbi:helicase-related protein [Methylopila musalis]|uniref:Helicase-related protein n=1 Tax=Methylopila musalis TaxID=1134781 RepID=A0ABW3Z463_9HYPH